MTEDEQGRMDFAAGLPYSKDKPARWQAGWMSADLNHQYKRDRHGHATNPPHLCPRDSHYVCNCCQACEAICRLSRLVEKMTGKAREVLQRLLSKAS